MSKKRKRGRPGSPHRAAAAVGIVQAPRDGLPAPDRREALEAQPVRTRLRFLVRAVSLMGLLYAAYYFPYPPDSLPARAIDLLLALHGSGAAWLIGLVEDGVAVQGSSITGRFPLQVVKACSSLDAQALFAATVIAFPAAPRAKLLGLLLGALVLNGLNIARIAALYFVGVHAPSSFDWMHEEVLPIVLVGAAGLSFFAWAGWVVRAHTLPAGQACRAGG